LHHKSQIAVFGSELERRQKNVEPPEELGRNIKGINPGHKGNYWSEYRSQYEEARARALKEKATQLALMQQR